ncbi:MAG: hypothetical protein ACOX7F_02185 [Eubacteriales bacterium]
MWHKKRTRQAISWAMLAAAVLLFGKLGTGECPERGHPVWMEQSGEWLVLASRWEKPVRRVILSGRDAWLQLEGAGCWKSIPSGMDWEVREVWFADGSQWKRT